MRFDNSGYSLNNFGSNDAEPDDDARDEAFNATHPCCETCQGLLCIDENCYCGFDKGVQDPEDGDLWFHRASAACRHVMTTRAQVASILGRGR
jgi:hypothetical protein